MKTAGFTLIELIIAITMASMMTIVLFTSFNQINRSARDSDVIMSISSRAVIFQNQFEIDISGAFIPNIDEVKEDKTTVKVETKVQTETKEQIDAKGKKETKEKISKETTSKVEAEKVIEEKKLEKAFFSLNDGKQLKELTFITCNPLQIYGDTRPRIARVVYRLKENKDVKGSFSLFRQESEQLNYSEIKKAVEYQVIDNIKELSIEFFAPESKKESQEPQKIKKSSEWKVDEKQKEQVQIPQFTSVKLVLWDSFRHAKEQTFEFKYVIYAFNLHKEKKPEAKKPEEKKEKQKDEKEKSAIEKNVKEKISMEQKLR